MGRTAVFIDRWRKKEAMMKENETKRWLAPQSEYDLRRANHTGVNRWTDPVHTDRRERERERERQESGVSDGYVLKQRADGLVSRRDGVEESTEDITRRSERENRQETLARDHGWNAGQSLFIVVLFFID